MKRAAFAIAFFSGLFLESANGNDRQAHMVTSGYTSIPIGHYHYCKSYSQDCRIKSRDTNPVNLTREKWNDLVEVNAFSNNTIAPFTDLEIYDQEEYWAYPESRGDCEDYVLMKRYMLMQRGWPASSLLITVVRQPNGDGHAVLTVRTDRADYILDNLEAHIASWNETPYTYLKRQSPNHSGRWETIIDNRTGSAS